MEIVTLGFAFISGWGPKMFSLGFMTSIIIQITGFLLGQKWQKNVVVKPNESHPRSSEPAWQDNTDCLQHGPIKAENGKIICQAWDNWLPSGEPHNSWVDPHRTHTKDSHNSNATFTWKWQQAQLDGKGQDINIVSDFSVYRIGDVHSWIVWGHNNPYICRQFRLHKV